MSKYRSLAVLALLVTALICMPATSRADCGYGLGLSSLNAFGSSGSVYGLGLVPVPPYYAIHPPVYYGHRVFRSYGDSPLARHPAPAPVVQARARMILNPHVLHKIEAKPVAPKKEEKKVAMNSLIIVNPYYHAEDKLVSHDASH